MSPGKSVEASQTSGRGDRLRITQSGPRLAVASYSVSRGIGREQVVMRIADGREAFRTDAERATTVIARGVEVPPLPEAGTVAVVKPPGPPIGARRSSPIGCERALSSLVKASASSAARCLT